LQEVHSYKCNGIIFSKSSNRDKQNVRLYCHETLFKADVFSKTAKVVTKHLLIAMTQLMNVAACLTLHTVQRICSVTLCHSAIACFRKTAPATNYLDLRDFSRRGNFYMPKRFLIA